MNKKTYTFETQQMIRYTGVLSIEATSLAQAKAIAKKTLAHPQGFLQPDWDSENLDEQMQSNHITFQVQ